jgi:hypothetical protein
MFDPVSDHLDGKSFGIADGFLASLPVGHHAREFQGLGNPAAVIFPVDLDGKVHPYIVSWARYQNPPKVATFGRFANRPKVATGPPF